MFELFTNLCDECEHNTAVYIEQKRRRGRLTRDRLCAGCVRKHASRHYPKHLVPLANYKKIH